MSWAAQYVGIAFEEKGRGARVDCWGLLWRVYREVRGIELPQFLESYEGTHGDGMRQIAEAIRANESHWMRIQPGSEREFDGVLVRMMGLPMHVGIVIAPGQMLHVMEGYTARIDRYRTRIWEKKILGFYRYADA